MTIQAIIAHNAVANIGFANPVKNLGSLAITMLATHIISNLPGAEAKEAPSAEKDLCKKLCEPLPGGENDAPEQICTETCEKGGKIIKNKTKEALKDGKWTAVKVLENVATPLSGYFDCEDMCSPIRGGQRAMYDLASATWKLLWKRDRAGAAADATLGAAKAGCLAFLTTQAGRAGCMTCCAAAKMYGIG